ncbi:HvfB family MNIO-type RiPP peptide maturase [Arenimonas alkanexedens]
MTATPRLAPVAAGLGLRRALMGPLRAAAPGDFDFLECAPDNWIGVGGRFGEGLRELSTRHPLVCHGLSLSLGAVEPFDETYLLKLRRFLDEHRVPMYSEHLSYCSDDGQLYDLMPIPFTDEAVHHVAGRIRHVQETLGRRIAVENISYYAAPYQAMPEIDFINAVLAEADCDLLLDVNNIFVNAVNHRYDAHDFLRRLPGERIAYYHVAGHYDEADDLKVDTHGAAVKPGVWELLDAACATFGPRPALLERDFNFPPYAELVAEVATVREVLNRYAPAEARHVRA